MECKQVICKAWRAGCAQFKKVERNPGNRVLSCQGQQSPSIGHAYRQHSARFSKTCISHSDYVAIMRLGVLGHLGRLVAAEQWKHTTLPDSSGSRHIQHMGQQQHRRQQGQPPAEPELAERFVHRTVSVVVSSHYLGFRCHGDASCSSPAV